jgi:hypothetical protein
MAFPTLFVSGFQMVFGPFGGHFDKTIRKPDIRVRFGR